MSRKRESATPRGRPRNEGHVTAAEVNALPSNVNKRRAVLEILRDAGQPVFTAECAARAGSASPMTTLGPAQGTCSPLRPPNRLLKTRVCFTVCGVLIPNAGLTDNAPSIFV